mmetsp:Transcript_58899/g.116676  ORF Transcript_58899/g.116676 Transcript_58899/m.116676 type:complete len:219 (+) Transcript_58899:364-1020(+)
MPDTKLPSPTPSNLLITLKPIALATSTPSGSSCHVSSWNMVNAIPNDPPNSTVMQKNTEVCSPLLGNRAMAGMKKITTPNTAMANMSIRARNVSISKPLLVRPPLTLALITAAIAALTKKTMESALKTSCIATRFETPKRSLTTSNKKNIGAVPRLKTNTDRHASGKPPGICIGLVYACSKEAKKFPLLGLLLSHQFSGLSWSKRKSGGTDARSMPIG